MYAQQPDIESHLAVGDREGAYRAARGFKYEEIPEPVVEDTQIMSLYHLVESPLLQGSAAEVISWACEASGVGDDPVAKFDLAERLVMISSIVRAQHLAQAEYDRKRLARKSS